MAHQFSSILIFYHQQAQFDLAPQQQHQGVIASPQHQQLSAINDDADYDMQLAVPNAAVDQQSAGRSNNANNVALVRNRTWLNGTGILPSQKYVISTPGELEMALQSKTEELRQIAEQARRFVIPRGHLIEMYDKDIQRANAEEKLMPVIYQRKIDLITAELSSAKAGMPICCSSMPNIIKYSQSYPFMNEANNFVNCIIYLI